MRLFERASNTLTSHTEAATINYFASPTAAARYAIGRPHYHDGVVQRIRAFLGTRPHLNLALDLACGTGLSTRPLRGLAHRVIGLDIAEAMLVQATPAERVFYAVASGEHLPLPADCADLLTIASAFHWMQGPDLLAEAARVLRASGWLVVYDNYFAAHMQENDSFANWWRHVYLSRYPSPSRAPVTFELALLRRLQLELAHEEHYENAVSFSPAQLVAYLTTQSNVIAAVEGDGQSITATMAWLHAQTAPFFAGRARGTFAFHGPIWYLQKRP